MEAVDIWTRVKRTSGKPLVHDMSRQYGILGCHLGFAK
jgi:hypothetical protein